MTDHADHAENGRAREGVDVEIARRLFERRMVVFSGPLDEGAAARVAAELMTLDADGDEPIELVVNSPGGPLECAVPVLDVVDLLRGPVDATCIGQAVGTAAFVVACATGRRRASPRARLGLRLAEVALEGSSSRIDGQVGAVVALRDDLVDRLARSTGRAAADLVAATERGPLLSAPEAVAAGLLDEVAERR